MDNAPRLSLYRMDGCPWCERVRAAIEDLQISVDERDVRADGSHAQALREARGRSTVPVLRIDTDAGTEWLPESADIVRRLYADYGNSKPVTFFASQLPQRLGMLIGGALLIGAVFAPEDARAWMSMAAVGAWLLGNRSPLLRRIFRASG